MRFPALVKRALCVLTYERKCLMVDGQIKILEMVQKF